MLATGGEGGGHLSKSQFSTWPDKQGVRAFIDRIRVGRGSGVGAVTCRNSTVISNSHLQLVIRGLTSSILVALGMVNLQFWGCTCSHFFAVNSPNCGSSNPGYSLVLIVNLSTWCFGIYKTAHRIWLRILSTTLEKELKVPDYVYIMFVI